MTAQDDLQKLTGNPWDRLVGEKGPAWEAFKQYRDMGPTRSVPKLAKQIGKPRTTLATYSSKYSWLMRAAAWDAEQDRLDQIWLADERKKAAKRHVRQAQSLQSKWMQRLQSLDPAELSASEVLRYAEIATKMERDALRMTEPDTVVNVNMPMVQELSVEDTRHRLEVLQREIASRVQSLPASPTPESEKNDDEVLDGELMEEEQSA